jgi:hypothetical protein
MTRDDFQRLARLRAREARTLFRADLFDGAYYLAGLAIECAIKACIAKATVRYEFPDRRRTERAYSHDLASLLREAGLYDQLLQALPSEWSAVKAWSIDVRYEMGKAHVDTADFMRASLGRRGVLSWLTRFW